MAHPPSDIVSDVLVDEFDRDSDARQLWGRSDAMSRASTVNDLELRRQQLIEYMGFFIECHGPSPTQETYAHRLRRVEDALRHLGEEPDRIPLSLTQSIGRISFDRSSRGKAVTDSKAILESQTARKGRVDADDFATLVIALKPCSLDTADAAAAIRAFEQLIDVEGEHIELVRGAAQLQQLEKTNAKETSPSTGRN